MSCADQTLPLQDCETSKVRGKKGAKDGGAGRREKKSGTGWKKKGQKSFDILVCFTELEVISMH